MVLGWGEQRKSYGGFTLTEDEVRANTPPSLWSQVSPESKKAMLKIGGVLVGLAAFTCLVASDYRNQRNAYNNNLEIAKSLVNAQNTPENMVKENGVRDYIQAVENEVDLRHVSDDELHVLNRLVDNNKIQHSLNDKIYD